MAAESMDASRALAGGGYGLPPPFWKPNWRADYTYSSGSSSSAGTSLTTPSSYYSSTSGGSSSPQGIRAPLDVTCRDAQDPGKKLISSSSFEEELCSVADDGDPCATTSFVQFAGRWTRALTEIAGSTRDTLLAAHDVMLRLSVPEEQQEPRRPVHSHVQSARFAQASILKMLPFVDDVVAVAAAGGVGFAPAAAPAEKLRPLIAVREALSRASQDIRLSSCSTPSAEAKSITDEVACLLSSEQGKLDEAIWNTMEQTRTRLLKASTTEQDDGSWPWGSQTPPQGSPSPAIHKVTRAIVSYINLLASTDASAAVAYQVADQAALLHRYVPKIDSVSPLGSLIMETASCLEEKLAEISRSWFPEQSLRFLFLINNSYFICQELSPAPVLGSHVAALARKVDCYIETYLQVSWAPVLSCLYIARPLCLGRYCSPAMFEAEFQKTYSAQKLWKVPDPKLRRRLRVAVVEKVVSGFAKYLEYSHVSPSRITPQDLVDMLQELFEG
ncbi:hypothetical protein BS78_10G261400 [Paspalum vaginatum]|nr:hypothetical protein BS78_10G261400 [Paspalum vaginatum]